MPANKTIKIYVEGGCVTDVTDLPEGYDYEIHDHDHKEAEETEKNFKKFKEQLKEKRDLASS
jgi:hypothetical protein